MPRTHKLPDLIPQHQDHTKTSPTPHTPTSTINKCNLLLNVTVFILLFSIPPFPFATPISQRMKHFTMTTEIAGLTITSIASLASARAVATQTMATDAPAHVMDQLLFRCLDPMLDIPAPQG